MCPKEFFGNKYNTFKASSQGKTPRMHFKGCGIPVINSHSIVDHFDKVHENDKKMLKNFHETKLCVSKLMLQRNLISHRCAGRAYSSVGST